MLVKEYHTFLRRPMRHGGCTFISKSCSLSNYCTTTWRRFCTIEELGLVIKNPNILLVFLKDVKAYIIYREGRRRSCKNDCNVMEMRRRDDDDDDCWCHQQNMLQQNIEFMLPFSLRPILLPTLNQICKYNSILPAQTF